MSPVLAGVSPLPSLAVDARGIPTTIIILALPTTGWQGTLEVVAVGLSAVITII
jgi:hypothetical protein